MRATQEIIIGRTTKSVTELLQFFAHHTWRWIPTNSYSDVTFYQVSHSLLNVVDNTAESEGNLASVDSAGSNSLEGVASTSNASESHCNVRHSFPLLTFISQNSHQIPLYILVIAYYISLFNLAWQTIDQGCNNSIPGTFLN